MAIDIIMSTRDRRHFAGDLDQRWLIGKQVMKFNMDARKDHSSLNCEVYENCKIFVAQKLISQTSLSISAKRKLTIIEQISVLKLYYQGLTFKN